MIKHIVMFKVKPELATQKEEIKREIKNRLEALPSKISLIKSFEVGANIKESDRSFDLVLSSSFENLDTLKEYAVHPDHVEVVDYVRETCEKTVVVDYDS